MPCYPNARWLYYACGFFIRLVVAGQHTVFALLSAGRSAPRSWLRAVEADFAFVKLHTALFSGPGFTVPSDLGAWANMIKGHPKVCRTRLASALADPAPNRIALWSPKLPSHNDLVPSSRLPCPQCAKLFDTPQAMRVHQFNAHGKTRAVRQLVDTLECPACLRCYGSREALLNHIGYGSQRCRDVVSRCLPMLPPESVAALDAANLAQATALKRAGFWSTHTTGPPITAMGPLRQEAYAVGLQHTAHLRLQRRLPQSCAVDGKPSQPYVPAVSAPPADSSGPGVIIDVT